MNYPEVVDFEANKLWVAQAEYEVLKADLGDISTPVLELLRAGTKNLQAANALLIEALGLLLKASTDTESAEFYAEIVYWLGRVQYGEPEQV